MDRKQEREKRNDMQQEATGWNQTCGHVRDRASVYSVPALLAELSGALVKVLFSVSHMKTVNMSESHFSII